MNIIIAVLFLLSAIRYFRKFHSKLSFDNIYLNRLLYLIDDKRRELQPESSRAFPLRLKEKFRYIHPCKYCSSLSLHTTSHTPSPTLRTAPPSPSSLHTPSHTPLHSTYCPGDSSLHSKSLTRLWCGVVVAVPADVVFVQVCLWWHRLSWWRRLSICWWFYRFSWIRP